MKKIVLFVLSLLFATILSAQKPYRLHVSIYGNGIVPGDIVHLYKFDPENLRGVAVDSLIMGNDSEACFTGTYEHPEIVALGVKGKSSSGFFLIDTTDVFAYGVLLKGKTSIFNPSGCQFKDRDVIVDGGKENKALEYYKTLQKGVAARIKAMGIADSTRIWIYREALKVNPNSWGLLYLLQDMKKFFSLEEFDQVLTEFTDPFLRSSGLYSSLVNYKNKEMKLRLGTTLPDFELPSITGEDIAISSLRGHYVLIDFWASWCGPCNAELANIRKAYEMLKDKGLYVVSVSTDAKEKDWRNAVEKKGMEDYINLHDNQRVLWKLFNRDAIPFILLIDPEGRIVGKELRGEKIYELPASLMK